MTTSKGHREAIPDCAGFVKGDLLVAGRLTRVLDAGFDGVLHFAALSLLGESVEQPKYYYRTNVLGTLNLLEAMRLAGVPNSTAHRRDQQNDFTLEPVHRTLPILRIATQKSLLPRLVFSTIS